MNSAINPVRCLAIYNDRKFFGVKFFDCRTIHLFTEKSLQGTFLTCIPISSASYRAMHPTNARVKISKVRNWVNFEIYDDRGNLTVHKNLKKSTKKYKIFL